MKKYIEIDIEYIMDLYRSGKSMREIERLTDLSFTKIQKEISSYEFNKRIKEKYKEIEGKEIIAICKKTNKEFIDYKNSSGDLTTHLKSIYPNIRIESNYKRKSFEYTNFKFWYDEYFTFIYKDIIKKKKKKCRFCDWETVDVDNLSGAYSNHLKNIHSIDLKEHVKKYPNDALFFKKITRRTFKDHKDYITCKICNGKYKVLSNTHMKKHGITLNEYKEKYNVDRIYGDYLNEYLKNNYKKHLKNKPFLRESKGQKQISDFLKKINIEHTINDRKVLGSMELDIYIPDHDIAIEYNGIFYHTEIYGKKDRLYHYNKMMECKKKDISLISIFEDEWVNNKEIVESKLMNYFNLNKTNKIYARKCIIKEIETKEKNKFLNEFHIQGEDRSVVKLGAFYNDILVAVMTFDNKRQFSREKNHDSNDYELKRFATNINYTVIGIGSKLFSFFKKNYEFNKIISFLDNRWAVKKNNIYDILGFKYEKELKPDYSYFNSKIVRNKRLHKFGYGKTKLKEFYPEIYHDDKTEWEIMQEAGFDRIWDCGKLKYVYENNSTSI